MAEGKREKSKYPGVYWRVSSETGEKSYYIRYRLGGRGSKEVEEPVGKSSKGMTEAKAAQVRSARMVGKSKPNTVRRAEEQATRDAAEGRMTVAKLWASYTAAKTLSVKRAQTDKSRFENYLAKPFGNKSALSVKEPHEIDALSVARLTKKLRDEQLSPATVWGVLELLRRIVNFGVGLGVCNPLGFKIDMPKIDNEKTEYMNDDQVRAYLAALDEEPDQDSAAFFRIMLLTGIRRTALLSLRWEDIDLERGFLVLQGKTAKSGKTKTIPLSPAAAEILIGITPQYTDGELIPYIWPGKGGGPREDFRRMGRRLRDKAGLPKDFRPCHGLRHHYATTLASSGEVDLYVLQRLLTHGSPAMTARYGHLTDSALKRAAAVAEGIIEVGQEGKVVEIGGKE